MTFGTFAQYAYGELAAQYDQSVANPFRLLLEDPDVQLRYLIELYPYVDDVQATLTGISPFGSLSFGEFDAHVTGGLKPIYLSDRKFITEPTDNPANQYFAPLVNNPLQFDTSIWQGSSLGGRSPSFGAIQIANDEDVREIVTYNWAGRRIVVKAGSSDFTYAQYTTVFDGLCNDIEADEKYITVTIRDNSLKTEQMVSSPLYAGTGDLEGGDNISGSPKPLCYGQVFNIEPVLVDPANLIYQIHDGSIQSVDAVRDAGAAITFGGDVSDITAATVSAGQYKTQLSGGYIKLGSTPSGRITADCKGSNAGGYKETVGEIARDLVQTRLGARSLAPDEIDVGSFNAVDQSLDSAAGLYITDREPASDILDRLINPCGAYWTFSRRGLLQAGILDEPEEATYAIDVKNIANDGIQLIQTVTAAWRISIGYSPSWVVQKEDELVGSTTDEVRSFVGQEYRTTISEDRAVRTRNDRADDLSFFTNLADKTRAEALGTRLKRIYGKIRRVYRVRLHGGLFRVYNGDTVKLTYDKYGLQNGKNLLVVGVSEDAEANQTILELWG